MNMPQPPSVFYLGSYLKTPTDSILLTLCVEKDDYDNVKTITAAPEDPAKSLDVRQYGLTASETLRPGAFLGTKYKSPSSSGVFRTIDDTLNHIAQSTAPPKRSPARSSASFHRPHTPSSNSTTGPSPPGS
ncbi:MAG: hypothetical protein ACLUFW_05930 [Alistipes sp.]